MTPAEVPAYRSVQIDDDLRVILDFYEVVTHHGSRERLKSALTDIVNKHVRNAEREAGR